MTQDKINYWLIKYVDEETKRKVKSYAARHGLQIAEALKQLVDKALSNTTSE
jgi:hypothetical protein